MNASVYLVNYKCIAELNQKLCVLKWLRVVFNYRYPCLIIVNPFASILTATTLTTYDSHIGLQKNPIKFLCIQQLIMMLQLKFHWKILLHHKVMIFKGALYRIIKVCMHTSHTNPIITNTKSES